MRPLSRLPTPRSTSSASSRPRSRGAPARGVPTHASHVPRAPYPAPRTTPDIPRPFPGVFARRGGDVELRHRVDVALGPPLPSLVLTGHAASLTPY